MELTVEVSQNKWPAADLLPGLFEANLPAMLAFPLAAAFSGLRLMPSLPILLLAMLPALVLFCLKLYLDSFRQMLAYLAACSVHCRLLDTVCRHARLHMIACRGCLPAVFRIFRVKLVYRRWHWLHSLTQQASLLL